MVFCLHIADYKNDTDFKFFISLLIFLTTFDYLMVTNTNIEFSTRFLLRFCIRIKI